MTSCGLRPGGGQVNMTRSERIRLIQRDMRIAKSECKWELYRELLEELVLVLR